MTDYPNPTTSHDPNDNTIPVAAEPHEDHGDVNQERRTTVIHVNDMQPGDSMGDVRFTAEGYRVEVEPFMYRKWACFLRAPDKKEPVWGVFGIQTSSKRIAEDRCVEMWEGFWEPSDDG